MGTAVTRLRHNEYYGLQNTFDKLYELSKSGSSFKNLFPLLISDNNLKLAYRNIKRNKGSVTAGVNRRDIKHIEKLTEHQYLNKLKSMLSDYKPGMVKRVFIDKKNGKKRPLGIPNIEDRLIQQSLRQIIEPIAEAKFYNHSYGFRPNRSVHHAMARCMHLVNQNQLTHVVDIDIKGFFDNVDHNILIKKLWNIGIRDKRILMIIKKILKSEVRGEGIPDKGTPQGGVISPLLANIYLNELDWWIASQWDDFPAKPRRSTSRVPASEAYYNKPKKYRALRESGSKLKEIFIVRYADDFKIFCRNHKMATKIFHAVKDWLKNQLKLDISPEKSKIINLVKRKSDFLGFEMKAFLKENKVRGNYILRTYISKGNAIKIFKYLKQIVKEIQVNTHKWKVMRLNAYILSIHEYYKIASNIYLDLDEWAYKYERVVKNRLSNHITKEGYKTEAYKKYYENMKGKKYAICGLQIFPLLGVGNTPPMNFRQEICDYTKTGRVIIHKNLSAIDENTLRILRQGNAYESIEMNDVRISKYISQNGYCRITNLPLFLGDMDLHHIKRRTDGGSDNYRNLILVTKNVHKLIHATIDDTIKEYKDKLNLNNEELKILNEFRMKAGNFVI
jgi:group II intron reverse transcriptase/maturase